MKKNILDVMKLSTAKTLNGLQLDLISLEAGNTVDKETGERTDFVRVDVEVAKRNGLFSRCQFSVKIPDTTKLKVSVEELETSEYQAFFTDLSISYIDTKGNVYFKASSYDVEKMED